MLKPITNEIGWLFVSIACCLVIGGVIVARGIIGVGVMFLRMCDGKICKWARENNP
jgi:hypothetical protein